MRPLRGRTLSYKRRFITIPSLLDVNFNNDITKYFKFRIKLYSKNNYFYNAKNFKNKLK
jgi:hypothetical protein